MFQTLFYQPILNLLVFLYNIIPGNDLGVAILFLTIVIKVMLLPLSKKAIKAQKALQELQPKIDELKVKYKDKKEEMGKAMMELYKAHKINPLSSCLPILIQFPFLIAVFMVFRDGFDEKFLGLVYPFIERPETIHTIAFGFLDLAKPNVVLAVLAGAAQFWQTKMMMVKKPVTQTPVSRDQSMTSIMNKQMLYFMPAITVFIGISLPGGLTLYWFLTTVLTAIQQIFVFKQKNEPQSIPATGNNNSPILPQSTNKIVEGEIVNKDK